MRATEAETSSRRVHARLIIAGHACGMNEQSNGPRDTSEAAEHQEGPVAKAIEEQTAKVPSDVFLIAAAGAAAASLALHLCGREKTGNFVAQWTPTILICGLYNKLVKQHGHDRVPRGPRASAQIEAKRTDSHPDRRRSPSQVIPAGGAESV